MNLKAISLAILALGVHTVNAQGSIDIEDVISQYFSIYGSNSALDSWANYVSTRSFLTPSALASWISAVESATDSDELESLNSNFPTSAYSQLMTQYYPSSIMRGLTGYLEINDGIPTGSDSDSPSATEQSSTTRSGSSRDSSNSSSNDGKINTPYSVGLAMGLSGLVAALTLF